MFLCFCALFSWYQLNRWPHQHIWHTHTRSHRLAPHDVALSPLSWVLLPSKIYDSVDAKNINLQFERNERERERTREGNSIRKVTIDSLMRRCQHWTDHKQFKNYKMRRKQMHTREHTLRTNNSIHIWIRARVNQSSYFTLKSKSIKRPTSISTRTISDRKPKWKKHTFCTTEKLIKTPNTIQVIANYSARDDEP